MKCFHTIDKRTHIAIDVWKCCCWNVFNIKKVFQPKEPSSLSILSHIIALANCEAQEESRKGKNPKSETVMQSMYNESYSASLRYFSWLMANGYSILLHSNHVSITFIIWFPLHLNCFSPITATLVTMVTRTQLFLSQTSILMCSGFLSS